MNRLRAGFPIALAGAVITLTLAAETAGASGAARSVEGVPVVTLIGDSVADAFAHSATARQILGQGVELKLEVAPCRRIAQESCPHEGTRAPTVLELVRALGPGLGATVVLFVGHNDLADEYPRDIEAALAALEAAGVRRVLWSTLRLAQPQYAAMNDAIVSASTRHPEMTVVDWAAHSLDHPEWCQEDGVHLNGQGVEAMAKLYHEALVELGIPVPPVEIATSRLPDARKGVPYAGRVRTRGGKAPYRWSFTRVPAGIHASADGRFSGRPRGRLGTYPIGARVVDALGSVATRQIPLRLRR